MLAERARVKQSELFDFMADTKNTLTEVKCRLAEHERQIAQNTRDIEQLKRATGYQEIRPRNSPRKQLDRKE